MLRAVLCFGAGGLLLLANLVDLTWTTLGTHGGGPISGRFLHGVWVFFLSIHKRWPQHRVLSFAGSAMLIILLTLWVAMLWAGWVCVFSAVPGAVVNAQTHAPADLASRIYYVAYAISTMGNGDFMANGDRWRIFTAFMTLGGLGTMSLAITFLLNVLAAVVAQRQLGSYISDLGGSPATIIARSWDGRNFDSLNDHLIALTGMVHLYTEQHLAYPVLHFFHSEDERTAATLRLAALYQLVFLLCHGVAEGVRPGPMVILPLQDAMDGMAKTMQAEFIKPADNPPHAPRLALLRELNIPTADDASYGQEAEKAIDTRRFFAGLLQHDGRQWDRVAAR